jgi:hypothetical protein
LDARGIGRDGALQAHFVLHLLILRLTGNPVALEFEGTLNGLIALDSL